MKKKIALILALCLALTSFSACSSSSKKGSGRSSNDRDSKYDADDDDDDDTGDDDDSEPTRATRETTERKDPTPTPSPVPTEAPVQIKPTENASINWTTYESPDGYFKINVPEGWTVFYHDYDVISYEVVVYDNYAEKFFYFGTSFVSYPSEENFEYWMDVTASYGFETTEYGYISPEATALSLFENSGDRFGYTDFELIDTLGENGYGDYFLQANIKDINNGRQYEGIFTSSLVDTPMYYQQMDWDLAAGTTCIMLPVEDFTDWLGVMLQIYASLEFTDAYYTDRNIVWQQTFQTSNYIMYNANQTSDMIMDSWERSNHVSDISSQEYSDATLGRERVYDTQTGDVYYADNGWSDTYSGTRYEPVTSGSDYYLQPVVGTIY